MVDQVEERMRLDDSLSICCDRIPFSFAHHQVLEIWTHPLHLEQAPSERKQK